jgi:hypothetical protein
MADMGAVGNFLEEARGATARFFGYEPPSVGVEEGGADTVVCSAAECGKRSDMQGAIKEGLPNMVGGGRRRRSRRRRSQRRRRQTRSRNAGRFAVNARIRIRLPRH